MKCPTAETSQRTINSTGLSIRTNNLLTPSFLVKSPMGESKTRPTYFCRNCENPLALGEDLISKKFVGASGPAFMFSHAMNVVVGPKIGRKLITGSYVVADVTCSKCGETLGWKYVETFDLKQRYKEGMFVIEKLKLTKNY
ncbi:unnamed protein product [Thlaspi arvense]|uniref:Protein yippee-like n=1 Tax=Thlaspi arvense TaxID=13288 RepID=A0AAU9T0S7_THLAR|nr:unnamed protein product [Thlaspi arvense]